MSLSQAKQKNIFGLPLSDRELDVLELLAEGYLRKDIAVKLLISTETVKKHLKNSYQKLGATNKVEAIRKAKLL